MAYIKGEDRNQIIMFPECMEDYIKEDNPVRIIDAFVDTLDLQALGFKRTDPNRVGPPSYNPSDMLKLYLYGYLNRVRSSRRLEHEANRNIEVIWLLKKLAPDFKTIADFRRDNKKVLKNVFREFTKLCDGWGLFGKEMVAIDGSKFRACNSKKNNFNVKKLDKHINMIDEKIEKYMQELDNEDKVENIDRKPSAEEIADRLKELKERKEVYGGYKEELLESGMNEISLTDPDARMMSSNNNGLDVSYNVQSTVDEKHKMIVDFKVTQSPNDLGELDNMALRAKKIFKVKSLIALADKGFYRKEDLKRCVAKGITPYVAKQTYSNGTGDKEFYSDKFKYDKVNNVYICPAGQELCFARIRRSKGKVIGSDFRNYDACSQCQFKNRCTTSKKGRSIFRHVDQDFLDTIDLGTEQNFETYKKRQAIVEHPFGTIKRGWGAHFFLTKGKTSVSAEVSLSFLAYNMKRAMNILGVREMLESLKNMKPALV